MYYHGIYVTESETDVAVPVTGTAGLQVVVGTAPINLAKTPAINTPVLCNSFADFVENFGYSADYEKFTLCASADASFKHFGVAPVIFINVLDSSKHVKENTKQSYAVKEHQTVINIAGVLPHTLAVTNSDAPLTADVDYVATFNDEGHVVITLLESGSAYEASTISVSSKSIAPESVTVNDIVGGYDAESGKSSGIEAIKNVYPMFSMVPGLLLAPYYSKHAEVAAALAAKCSNLNGVFSCECVVDLDCETTKKYTDCKAAKEEAGMTDNHMIVTWPRVRVGSKIYPFSSIYGAMVFANDIENGDVPNVSPSNILMNVSGIALADGEEVVMDEPAANTLNSYGIVTAINDNGWKAWGNNTACYPAVTDPKDRWIACRRFFTWWGNSFILTYKSEVDSPMNHRLIESIVDSENIRGNMYVNNGQVAAAYMEYREEDNPITEILNGKVHFRQYLAPYIPAESIFNTLSFDTGALESALVSE